MQSNGTTYPVVVLNNGVVVMGRDDGSELRARVYVNRTQAQHMADRIGGTVYQPRTGPAFYVAPPLPKQEPLPLSGGSDAPSVTVTPDTRCECFAGADGRVALRCALHAAAPAMRALLQRVQDWLDTHPHHDRLSVNDFVDGTGITAESSALLRTVEG